MIIIIYFVPFGCEHKNALDSYQNENKPKEIIWQQTSLDSFAIIAIAANSNGIVFAGTCGNGLFRSTDHGNTWDRLDISCTSSISINSKGDIFVSQGCPLGSNPLIRSTDNGNSWTFLSVGSGVCPGAPVFNKAGEMFVGSGVSDETIGGIYRSVDNGNTWEPTSFPDTLSAEALAINANGDIFAGTPVGVFRSTDNGETWTQINTGFIDHGFGPLISALVINFLTGDIYAAERLDGVYRSTNNGDTWTLTGLKRPNILSLVINSNGEIFAGSGVFSRPGEPEGVFYSKDNGATWTQINRGLTNLNLFSLTIDSSGFVYAATDGDGVFRTIESTIR